MNLIQGIKDFRQLNRDMYRLSGSEIRYIQEQQIYEMLSFSLANSQFYRDFYNINSFEQFLNFFGINIANSSMEKDKIESLVTSSNNHFKSENIFKFPDDAIKIINGDFFNFALINTQVMMNNFSKLPVINKQAMMDNFDGLNTCGLKKDEVMAFALEKEFSGDYTGYYKDRFVVGLSSGTSGNKGIYITPKELTERLPFVFLARGGIPLSCLPFRILFLLRVFSQGFEDINAPLIDLIYKSTMNPPQDLIDIINAKKINIIMAPPSMLRVMMEHAGQIKHRIKMIVSYAEVLEKEEKSRISSIFKSPVNEIYQASEGQIGSTCKCGSLHINEDLVFVELFDNDGNTVDQPGVVASKMIVTNLINNAQPLIRYEMNDVIVLGEKCKCGSSFRVIEKILGRNDDILVLRDVNGADRNVFPDLFARWIITTDDKIREFKVVQTSTDELEITVDLFCSKDSDKCDEQEDILEKLQRRITDELLKYEIKCNMLIVSQKIPLPRVKSKFKRFNRKW